MGLMGVQRERVRTIKKAGLHHFPLHKKLRLLRSQLSCCLFPRVPAASKAPPPLSPASPPIGRASPHSANPAHLPALTVRP